MPAGELWAPKNIQEEAIGAVCRRVVFFTSHRRTARDSLFHINLHFLSVSEMFNSIDDRMFFFLPIACSFAGDTLWSRSMHAWATQLGPNQRNLASRQASIVCPPGFDPSPPPPPTYCVLSPRPRKMYFKSLHILYDALNLVVNIKRQKSEIPSTNQSCRLSKLQY